jgi:hypothetical protein
MMMEERPAFVFHDTQTGRNAEVGLCYSAAVGA